VIPALSGITVVEVTLKRNCRDRLDPNPTGNPAWPIRQSSNVFLIGLELGAPGEGLPVHTVIEAIAPPGPVPEMTKPCRYFHRRQMRAFHGYL